MLSGCWDYNEIDELAIAVGLAIDKKENGDYIITSEVINPKEAGREAKLEPVVFQAEGKSLFDAIRNTISLSGKKLYWTHAKVIIVSEEIAREGLLPVLDWVHRDGEMRAVMWLMVARNSKAGDILKTKARLNSTIAFQLNDIFKSAKNETSYADIPLWAFIEILAEEGISPILATAQVRESEEEKIPEVHGIALFKGDKMIDWLDEEDSRTYSWLMENKKDGLLVIKDKKENKEGKIIYEVLDSSLKITPVVKDKQLQIRIEIKPTMNIGELNKTSPQFNTDEALAKLEEDINQYLEKQLKELITKLQRETRSDVIGFGQIIKEDKPELWKKIKDDWEKGYTEIPVSVQVRSSIRGSALNSTPLKVNY